MLGSLLSLLAPPPARTVEDEIRISQASTAATGAMIASATAAVVTALAAAFGGQLSPVANGYVPPPAPKITCAVCSCSFPRARVASGQCPMCEAVLLL
jgi:hypothetical protein